MKRLIFILLILLYTSANAEMSKNSIELEKLRINAIENPTKQNEMAYLEFFPSTFEKFYFTFYGKDCCEELYYKTMEHLDLINTLSKKYPDKVLQIRLNVATNGHWDADAVGFWQHELARYAATETKLFAIALNKRAVEQRESIVRFLADVENHYSYSSYRIASEKFNDLGYESLHKLFEKEKKRRISMDNH